MESQTAHLCQTLKSSIRTLGLTLKEVERRMGLSPGYLSRLFGGQIDLKVDHVVQIARVLEVESEEIFRLAFPPPRNEPMPKTLRLREGFGLSSPEQPPPAMPSQIEQEIERIVKRALASNRSA